QAPSESELTYTTSRMYGKLKDSEPLSEKDLVQLIREIGVAALDLSNARFLARAVSPETVYNETEGFFLYLGTLADPATESCEPDIVGLARTALFAATRSLLPVRFFRP